MARVRKYPPKITTTTWSDLIDDYVSKSDATAQSIASDVDIAGTLDVGNGITTEDLVVTSGSFTNLQATVISGSTYQNLTASAGVQSVAASGSTNLDSRVYFTGSGGNVVEQSGQVITISGSAALTSVTGVAASGSSDLIGKVYFTGSGIVSLSESGQVIIISGSQTSGAVTGLANSGSSLLTGDVYLTGSQTVKITQSGQSITISGSSDANTVEGLTVNQIRTHTPASHGSSHTSGSGDATSIYESQITDLHTLQLNIPSFTATGAASSGITGSLYVAGTISGGAYQGITTNAHASSHVAGSTDALTGNFVFTNLTATNITGSTLISGSSFKGPLATFTNLIATNVTGSSILSGANIYGPVATITNVYTTNVTGSGTLSGSLVRGSAISGSNLGITGNAVVTGNLSGSTISGSITMDMDGNARVGVRQNSGGTSYTRRRINLIEGNNISFTVGDDAVSEEVDITVTANYSMGSYSYIIYSSSGLYYAENEHGTVLTSGSDASTVIQAGINGLTSGRTYMERVSLKGSFDLATGLTVPAYTELDMEDALFTVSGVTNINAFTLSGANIYVHGGRIDGVRSNKSADLQGVLTQTTASNVLVENVYVTSYKGYGIRTYAGSNLRVVGCEVTDTTYGAMLIQQPTVVDRCYVHDIYSTFNILTEGSDITISNCIVETTGSNVPIYISNGNRVKVIGNRIKNTDSTAPYGIYVINTNEVVIVGNNVYFPNGVLGTNGNGITCTGNGTGSILVHGNLTNNCGINFENENGDYSNITISGNVIYNHGINLINAAVGSKRWSNWAINGNTIHCPAADAIGINIAASYGTICGNTINNNASTSYAAINLYGTGEASSSYVNVIGNSIANATNGIREQESANYNQIKNNLIYNTTNAIVKIGANSEVFGNLGHVTENSGTLTISATQTSGSATHGLAITPSAAKLCLTPQDNLGGLGYWVSATGSSTFTVSLSGPDAFENHVFGWNYV